MLPYFVFRIKSRVFADNVRWPGVKNCGLLGNYGIMTIKNRLTVFFNFKSSVLIGGVGEVFLLLNTWIIF